MSLSIRVVLAAAALCSLAACHDSPTAVGSNGPQPAFKADPAPPVATANLAGSWSTSPRQRVPWFDGVSVNGYMERWFVLSISQNGSAIRGQAGGFAQYFYADGTPLTGALSTGGGIKISGTVSSMTDAVIVFERSGEQKTTASYPVTINAGGTAMVVVNPTATGLQGFVR